MYIGLYPMFKYYLKSHPKHGEMWYTLVFTTVYRLGERPLREMKQRLFGRLLLDISNEPKYHDGTKKIRILEIGG